MTISTESDWRMWGDPRHLVWCMGGYLTDGERLLILTSALRPLWRAHLSKCDGVAWTMNRVELAAYGEADPGAVASAMDTIQQVWPDVDRDDLLTQAMLAACWEVLRWPMERKKFDSCLSGLLMDVQNICIGGPDPVLLSFLPTRAVEVYRRDGFKPDSRVFIERTVLAPFLLAHCNWYLSNTIREVVRCPFTTVTLDPEWLDEDVVHHAFSMFRSGNYSGMGQLGEMLEDRGCGDSEVLMHCLANGHGRGCWLVDAITGMRMRLKNWTGPTAP